MLFQHIYLLLAFAVLASGDGQQQLDECATTTKTTTTTDEPDPACNCDDLCGVIGFSKRDDAQGLLQEDSDMDGDPTICARNREMKDRTFHSVCHMTCHNSCSKFRVFHMLRDKKRVSYVAAYRNNFYKLHEGAC